jgi:small subunit ribosomal protein S9
MTTKKAVVKIPTQPLNTGRRKKSIARVIVTPTGNGKITVNKRDISDYFSLKTLQQIVKQPLVLTGNETKVDVIANVYGGGLTGQAGAIRLGITRGLVKLSETYKAELKKAGFLTRDSRVKERKKYGLKKARKSPQYSKR